MLSTFDAPFARPVPVAGEEGRCLAESRASLAGARLRWPVQWPDTELSVASDAALATDASGPGAVFLPPVPLRRTRFRVVLESQRPPQLPVPDDRADAPSAGSTPPSSTPSAPSRRALGGRRSDARRAAAASLRSPAHAHAHDDDAPPAAAAEPAWERLLDLDTDTASLVHLGHDPFEAGETATALLSLLPPSSLLVELPDGWYAGSAAASRALASLPPGSDPAVPAPLGPPPGMGGALLSALGGGGAGDHGGTSSPRAAGSGSAALGGPGSDPREVAAHFDQRRRLDGVRRLIRLEAAVTAELSAVASLRSAAGGVWGDRWVAEEGEGEEEEEEEEEEAAEAEALLTKAAGRGDGRDEGEGGEGEEELLRAALAAEEAAADEEEAAAAAAEEEAEELRSHLASLAASAEAEEAVEGRAAREAEVWDGMRRRQQQSLASGLARLFPVFERDGSRGVLSIKGLLLSEHEVTRQVAENTSTALGYVAQLTSLLAAYLGVTLRYTLVCIASRSYVRDDVDPFSPSRHFPLFPRGRADDSYRVGLRMLRRNVEQLLLAQGVAVPDRAPLLAKVRLLVRWLVLSAREPGEGSAVSGPGGGAAADGTASVGGASGAGGGW